MTAIERTAYPRFGKGLAKRQLAEFYTPTAAQIEFAHQNVRGPSATLCLLVLLKTFENLGHFKDLDTIPQPVISHIRASIGFTQDLNPQVEPRTLYRHHRLVREFLGVQPWSHEARAAAQGAMHRAAQCLDNPADLINAAIDALVRSRFELPGYTTLDELAASTRAVVNHAVHLGVQERLTQADTASLRRLVSVTLPNGHKPYNGLKQLPKSPSLSHLQDLVVHLVWLSTLPNTNRLLAGIPHAKVLHFAAEARSLDAAEMKDVSEPKRWTLVLSLLHKACSSTRDSIAEMLVIQVASAHKRAKEELEQLQQAERSTTEQLVGVLAELLRTVRDTDQAVELAGRIQGVVDPAGGTEPLLAACEKVLGTAGNNHLPLVYKHLRSHRQVLMQILRSLQFVSTSADQSLVQAIAYLRENSERRSETLPQTMNLDFAPRQWQHAVVLKRDGKTLYHRRHFEACVLSCLASELRSGDIAITGSEQYADHRAQLLSWPECEALVGEYCGRMGLPDNCEAFAQLLKDRLARTAATVDANCETNDSFSVTQNGKITLKREKAAEPPASAIHLQKLVHARLPERSLLEMLTNVEHWLGFTRHFGPLSGSDPKLDKPRQKYLLTCFGYGTNLGPYQAARHLRGAASAHTLSYVNRRHVGPNRLDAAVADIVNRYNELTLPTLWGDGTSAAADGTHIELSEENPFAQYHVRYGAYGGIAYHHVSDKYIALMSHFIPCGVWEAVFILEGLLKNKSDIQPDTMHADTQGQSTPVFALAYLLGIKLMPRIRNWQDLQFFRPDKDTRYEHLDALFTQTVDWELLKTHWQDLMRVVLSVQLGKISSATLLRQLSSYSRKNRVYQAFRELGRVIRTCFLLEYVSDRPLRERITAVTNIAEAYHKYSQWFSFGGEILTSPDPEEQQKAVKYNDLVANAVILHNAVDLTRLLRELQAEGQEVRREDVACLSPYLTGHIKRFGDYEPNVKPSREPTAEELMLVL